MKKIGVAFAVACASASAFAQHAGDNVISAGWFHVAPQDSSTPETTHIAGVPINTPLGLPTSFTSEGTGSSVNNANTLGITISHFLTDHIAVTTVAGVPPKFKVSTRGTIMPPGPAGALGHEDLGDPSNNPFITSVREWSPTLLLQYYFRDADAKFRPFLGAGISYNFFSGITMNPNASSSIANNLGAVLAAGANKPGSTIVSASSSHSFQPVLNAGITYAIDKHWSILGSISYIPLKTQTTIKIRAADGTTLATSKAELKVDPIISYLAVSYRF